MEKKKVIKKVVKKEVKLSVKDRLIETVNFIEKSVKDERGKSLNITSCAKLNNAAFTINNIIKTL